MKLLKQWRDYEIKTIYLDLSDEFECDGTSKKSPNDYEKV